MLPIHIKYKELLIVQDSERKIIMGITNANKEVSTTRINCEDTFDITLSLTASPDIVENPTDIALTLDRSQSMAGNPLANLKSGVKKFIDIIADATGGTQDGQIGSGSRIGIVSFSNTAVQDTQLITSVADLKAAADSLIAGGSTNHGEAFEKATELFDPQSMNAKVIVMFTDGQTTAGPPPTPIADAAKAQGIIIFCIGLNGNGGVDEQALDEWASPPSSSYVAIAPDDAELEAIFEDLAKNITKPGATDIVLKDILSPCFNIVSLSTPTKGSANILDSTSVEWRINELGVDASEGAVLEFTAKHVGGCSGDTKVNENIIYTDNERNVALFPDPSIEVDCGDIVVTEPCPAPLDVTINGCEDSLIFDAGDLEMDSTGRILQLSVTLKNVCPQRRIALAAIVKEVDSEGLEYKRGFRTMTIPAHNRETCQDVKVSCIKFVLPEDLSLAEGADGFSICGDRQFKASFIAHYIDTDYQCCDVLLQPAE